MIETTGLARAMWAPVRHAMPPGPHELPACMCGILRRAVEDAMAVQELPGYKLDMGSWHTPNGVCRVCMAGAVMVRTLKAERDDELEPADFGMSTGKLYAVNAMRTGSFINAYNSVYGYRSTRSVVQNNEMTRASEIVKANYAKHDKRGYAEWKVYLQAAGILEAVGL